MKKVYVNPVTETFQMNVATLMAGSLLNSDDNNNITPTYPDRNTDDYDQKNGNLSKGGSIWDAWD